MNILNFPYAVVYFVLKNKHVYWTVSVTPSLPGNVQSWCVLKYAEVNFCWRQWGCCEKKRNKDWNCYLHNKKKLNLILNKHEHSIREGLAGDIRTIQASWPNLKITFKARNERKRNCQEKKLSYKPLIIIKKNTLISMMLRPINMWANKIPNLLLLIRYNLQRFFTLDIFRAQSGS